VIKLNGSEDLAKAGKGWGVDWNGDFIFQIEDLPLEKMEKAIKNLEGVIKDYVDGKTVYTFIGLKLNFAT